MTMHYGETITPEEVLVGWRQHGKDMPMAYGQFSLGDKMAYYCWVYLCLYRGDSDKECPTIEEFWKNVEPEDVRRRSINLLNEVMELLTDDDLVKSDPWPLNQGE